ncbi:MAG: TetR/AcrR family transcriptional regulator [Acidimicrobiales bacterium]
MSDPTPAAGLIDQVIERRVADDQQRYTAEVAQLIDATYTVIARTGSFDPPIRAILAEAGLSNPAFYRHFRSKDELMLALLDEGRRQLVDYLAHRTADCDDDNTRTAEWVRGVLAQSTDPDAAQRTRPFVTQVQRLHERLPAQQESSEAQLIAQLADILGPDRGRWAAAVYVLVFGTLERHLRTGRPPTEAEVEEVVAFVLAGVGADS